VQCAAARSYQPAARASSISYTSIILRDTLYKIMCARSLSPTHTHTSHSAMLGALQAHTLFLRAFQFSLSVNKCSARRSPSRLRKMRLERQLCLRDEWNALNPSCKMRKTKLQKMDCMFVELKGLYRKLFVITFSFCCIDSQNLWKMELLG
jgi:hypothetical protein